MELPRFYLVRQHFPNRAVTDIAGTVQSELTRAGFAAKLKPGSRVAVGVGSRGINNIATIVKAVVDFWKAQGMKPFIFPAMGSHGAATAEGQASVLEHYGVHEAAMGCPVISGLEVVSLGTTAEGLEAFMDRNAFGADGVMIVSRVKWHTDFSGALESGLFKMMAIGIGKFAGAQNYHNRAYNIGMERVIRSVGRQVLASGKMLGGLAILEDAHHNTAHLSAVPAEGMEQQEEALLAKVKSWMGRIPVDPLDVLILNRIGKPISGAGMDTKVVNRGVNGEYNPWPDTPRINRIYIRDLHPDSYGNGVGLGMADIVHDRLLAKVDFKPTWINAITATTMASGRTPIHFNSDRQCLETLLPSVGKLDLKEVTVAWFRDTMNLSDIAMSENLLDRIKANSSLEILSGPVDIEVDAEGNFKDLLAR